MAIASVKSATTIDRSRIAGCTKRPRLCRIPIDRLSMTETPIRIAVVSRERLCLNMRIDFAERRAL